MRIIIICIIDGLRANTMTHSFNKRQICTCLNVNNIEELEDVIRYAIYPDSPELLHHYLRIGKKYATTWPRSARHVVHERIFDLLNDVVCDSLLPNQWRELCVDHMYLPLNELERLATTENQMKLIAKRWAIYKQSCSYFFNSQA